MCILWRDIARERFPRRARVVFTYVAMVTRLYAGSFLNSTWGNGAWLGYATWEWRWISMDVGGMGEDA